MPSELIVKEIHDRAIWQSWFDNLSPDTFLQTWEWGEAQTDPIKRIGVFTPTGELQGAALLINIAARRARYILCPHGPLVAEDNDAALQAIIEYAISYGRNCGADFVRIAPLLTDLPKHRQIFSAQGFRKAPIHVHPELSWILNLSPEQDKLLANLRKTTRYSIRKAEKDGVTIRSSTEPTDLELFWNLYQATVVRQHFTPFSLAYLEREFHVFTQHQAARLFLADHQGETVAGALIIFTPQSAFYHHGASLQKDPKLTAAYLLQWAVIKYAKERGCRKYNFWGISPENEPKHPWAGLSLFKKGFGGEAHRYVSAQDKPLSTRYWLNWGVETIRRYRRGY